MRYVNAVNTGVGFITHADRALLSFRGRAGSMWDIDGDTSDIDDWIGRVSGTEKTAQEADDLEFAVTKFLYTSREFLLEVLTPTEIKFLIENYGNSLAIRNFLKGVLDNGADVGSSTFLTFVTAVKDAGYLSQARLDVIIAGRT